MNFFEYILAPFIFIIEQLFTFSYDITGNYGIAILLLSFGISLMLLPIFIYIEKAKKKDDVVKNKMKPLIDEIKRVYKGQERFYYIKTINRQHNYSSLKALIPILSLLIQIPFFIAAYQFLEGFAPLKEVSFMFISDLSKPDGLFGIVNILPIIMTIVNILTAYYYTRNGNKTEFWQMMVLAAAFLVLLFNLPAGLVLYWTMNNVFSFLRLFITNPEVFRKKEVRSEKPKLLSNYKSILPQLKQVFIYSAIGISLFQLYWAFNHTFDDIILRLLLSISIAFMFSVIVNLVIVLWKKYKNKILKLEVKPLVFSSLLFISIYLFLAAKLYYSGPNQSLILVAIPFLLSLQFIGYIYFHREAKASKLFNLTNFILVLLLLIQLISLISIIAAKPIELSLLGLNIKNINEYFLSFASTGILFAIITSLYFYRNRESVIIMPEKPQILTFSLIVIYLVGVLYLWNPLLVFSSYPDIFSFAGIDLLSNNVFPFLSLSVLSIIIYIVLPAKFKKYLLFASIMVVGIFFINAFVLPLNLGALHDKHYSGEQNLAAPIYYYLLEAIFIVLLAIFIKWIFEKKHFNNLKIALIILNLIVIGDSAFKVNDSGAFIHAKENVVTNGSIPFSKDKENVVLFLYDGFQGWFMDSIYKEDPQLKETLKGFTWYPNTVSVSSLTYSSTAGIMLGYDYSVDKLNKNFRMTNGEKVTEPCNIFIDKIQQKEYDLSSTIMWHSKVDNNRFDNFIPAWHDNWDRHLNIEDFVEIWYSRLVENALLYCSPLALKPGVYNDANWLVHYNKDEITSEGNKYNFLRLLPKISNTQSKEKNFIYIHNMASHSPWNLVDDNSVFHSDVSPYENNKWCLYQIAEWFKWMQENGVYDNTKIVILSDHGPTWFDYKPGIHMSSPYTPDASEPDKMPLDRFWRLNALLMVKDFNAAGDAKEDWRIMSNADASAIVFNENDPTKAVDTDRTLPTSWSFWKKRITLDKKYNVYKYFEVKGNMYDLKNWTEKKFTNEPKSYIEEYKLISLYDTTKVDIAYLEREKEALYKAIRIDEKWLSRIEIQATERGLSVDTMLTKTADYIINTMGYGHTKATAILIHNIKNDRVRLAKMKAKAELYNTDLEVVIEREANRIILDS